MMVCSYKLGQKHYPIPYAVKKLVAYVVLVVLIYMVHLALVRWVSPTLWFSVSSGLLLLAFFAWFVTRIEAREMGKLPVIGKYFIPKSA
jgi:thiol:disulfide interchange protein